MDDDFSRGRARPSASIPITAEEGLGHAEDSQTRESRVEDCFDTWWAWRAACTTVEEAYHAWTTARAAQRAFAFARYRAALDREEERAGRHAAHVAGRLGPTVEFMQTA